MGLLATYLSGIYYAFWCQPIWRDFYLSTVGGLFMFWAVYGIIPTIHWVTLHPDNISDPQVTAMLPRIIFMFLGLFFWHETGIVFAMFRLKHGCSIVGKLS